MPCIDRQGKMQVMKIIKIQTHIYKMFLSPLNIKLPKIIKNSLIV